MLLEVNSSEITKYPSEFQVTILDLDDADSTMRTADGTFYRDRVATKRQIEMTWKALRWEDVSAILLSMQDEFFDFSYPDPMTGQQETKNFYVGNREVPLAIIGSDGTYWWTGLKLTLTER